MRITRSGLSSVWVRCPQAALAIAKKTKIKIGWTIAKVELLKSRPLQCFKCWKLGHVKYVCKSDKDFSKWCYKCGQSRHVANGCKNKPTCPVCASLGREDGHRVGSIKCERAKGPLKNKINIQNQSEDKISERRTEEDSEQMEIQENNDD